MEDFDGLEPERPDVVEDPLARTEQNRGDVEGELIDDSGDQRLPNGRGAAGDVEPPSPAASRARA